MITRLDRVELRQEVGWATIVDGDTVTLHGERIRLLGIDAFEHGQRCRRRGFEYDCGGEASAELRGLIGGRELSCNGRSFDRYRRLLAVCEAAGRNVNAAMVEAGWALAYGGYEAEERRARAAHAGAWAGDFDPPSEWRASRGGLAESPHDLLQRLIGLLRALLSGSEKGES